MDGRRSRLAQTGAMFFCSGALGLGYELIWIRKAALVVGASQIAMSTVLTSFFVGLGLGSLVVGRRLRGTRVSPLVVYGLFEIGIGLYALAFPELFGGLERAYGALYPWAAGSSLALFGLRFVLLFLLCLPPTFLMGGTLPLLLDALVTEDATIGPRTSLLYGLNILGAVAGVLVTCYLAIPGLGMNGTSRAAGVGNLALGALALVLFRKVRPRPVDLRSLVPPAAGLVALAFASGAVAIAWQIAHARFFSLLDVTTIYTTAMLLALWLSGLAAGSLGLAPLLGRRHDPLRLMAAAQMLAPLVGLYTFGAAALVDLTPTIGASRAADGTTVPLDTLQVMPRFALIDETLDAVFFGPLVQIGLVVLPPVVLLGICLPALIAAATRHAPALRANAGTLVFWNTLGSSSGAFLAGYVLLPLAGLHGTLSLLGLASIAIGAAAWRLAAPRRPLTPLLRTAAGVVAATSVAGVAWFALGGEDLTRSTIERYGYGSGAQGRLVEIVEDAVGTAYVHESNEHVVLGAGAVAFAAANKRGVSPQAIQGHLPVLFFPGDSLPRRCLGVGIGSGQSLGALLMYPIEQLDVVDIFPGLVDLSLRHFGDYNHGLDADPRVRFHMDDGRHFVDRAASGQYDVVSMEPPPPRADGVYSLYSVDFYREVRRVLTPGGVFMQWLPLYRVTPLDARSIIRTQAEVFPETFLIKQGDEDFMLLSYRERPRFSVDALERRIATFDGERAIAGLRWSPDCAYEIASVPGLASALIAGPDAIRSLDAPAIYDDDTQLLCYGHGDRWLLRRYRALLAPITFAELPLSPMRELADYFDPPFSTAQAARLETERAASLDRFNVVDPALLERYRKSASSGATPAARASGFLALAAAHDVRLDKAAALDRIADAVRTDPGNDRERDVALVRRIARNHYAVYRDRVRKFVGEIELEFPRAPLVRSMRDAVEELERIERLRLERYLFARG